MKADVYWIKVSWDTEYLIIVTQWGQRLCPRARSISRRDK